MLKKTKKMKQEKSNLYTDFDEVNKARENLIRKIRPFIKNGHVACRGKLPYSLCFDLINKNTNCFEHACLNFKNVELLALDVNYVESLVFGGRYTWGSAKTKDEMESHFALFLEDVGLEFNECQSDEILKRNQWKVAVYLSPDWDETGSFHFLLQEKDGTWTAKDGFTASLSCFDKLEDRVVSNGEVYDFHKTFVITNQYAEEKLLEK